MSIFVIAEAAADQQQIPYWLNYSQAMSQNVLAIGVIAGGTVAIIKYLRRNHSKPTPANSVNRSNSVGWWIFGLTVLAAAIGWAGLFYSRGHLWASITVLLLLAVIIAPPALIILWREISPYLRKFNPKHIIFAQYGSNERGFHYWLDTGRSGEMLADYLRELLTRPIPARLTNEFLGIHDPAISGPHKILRFRLSDGRCFHLHEYGMITIDSCVPTAPFDPPAASSPVKAKREETKQFPKIDREGVSRARLISAQYGVGTRTREVLQRIKDLRSSGKPIAVNHFDLLDGDDPAHGDTKELLLEYSDGSKFRLFEHDKLSLFLDTLESKSYPDDWINRYLINP